jgi:hypothetical protein
MLSALRIGRGWESKSRTDRADFFPEHNNMRLIVGFMILIIYQYVDILRERYMDQVFKELMNNL